MPIIFANGGTRNGSLTTAEIASPAGVEQLTRGEDRSIGVDDFDDVAAGIDRAEHEHASLVGHFSADDPAEPRVAQPHGHVRKVPFFEASALPWMTLKTSGRVPGRSLGASIRAGVARATVARDVAARGPVPFGC